MTKKTPKKNPRPGIDEYGRSKLHNLIIDNNYLEAKKCIGNGENINLQDDNGWTPLHYAVQENNAEIVELLLKSGANCNLQDIFGNTPLFKSFFSSKGDGKIILALLNAGANPNLENKSGISPIKLAKQISNYDYSKYFQEIHV